MDRFKSIKKASILGILGNVFLVIIKGTVGFFTNSQAMLADTFNSATDIFSSLMTYVGNKIASIPNDEDHNLGHGKAEYIYSMLISIVMIFMSLFILKDAFLSLFFGSHYVFSFWLVVVCIVTILIKFLLFVYTNRLACRYNNLLIRANSKDHICDCVVTFCNLLSCLLALNGYYFFDGLVGVFISLWIIVTAFRIFKESYDVLMDKSISDVTKRSVYEIIECYDEIVMVSDFKSTPVGYRYQISFTIYVDGNLSTFDSHEIADRLEREICSSIEEIYLVVIHVNPFRS